MDRKRAFLTFDVEEYSAGAEFLGREHSGYEESRAGLEYLLKTVKRATYFVTADFAEKFPKQVRGIASKGNEVALHGDISKAAADKAVLERITGKAIAGFRAHKFRASESEIISLGRKGFSYDSSIHPTFVPGRYFGLFRKREPHSLGSLAELPPTTSKLLRIPASFLWFRLLPKSAIETIVLGERQIILYFHPWEFYAKEDNLIALGCGEGMRTRFENLLEKIRISGYELRTLGELARQIRRPV